jgi:eukaryotic-like serine/threonine-protein kinase
LLTSDRWQEVERLYHEALMHADAERSAFLRVACGDDSALRREVETLLAQEPNAAGFMSIPAVVGAAAVVGRSLLGRQFGPYVIQSPLGSGGMGEVYRARDTTLGRDVAMKVLPAQWLADPDRLARFERESRVLATLNHPHIGAIYGTEAVEGGRALVLELVEGPTLQERLEARRGLALNEALHVARQLADALEVAHEKGIIHRDLKPANIKITPDGVVKVLDFGLAKFALPSAPALPVPPASPALLTNSPTFSHATKEGVILGTAAYMSPEQARGQRVDKRTDIWAFGCVLYEMLTGSAPFPGATVTDTLAAILEREPDWTALSAATPTGVRKLLRRCLEKDAQRRLHDIADARLEIEDALDDPTGGASLGTSLPNRRPYEPVRWVAALLAAAAAGAAGSLWYASRLPQAPPELRVEITTPPTGDPSSMAISPDGRALVFVATSDGKPQLWLRTLDAVSPRPLPGTDDAARPFWSPDSRKVGFWANFQLKRIDLDSGAVRVLSTSGSNGGAWNRDDIILFSHYPDGALQTVSANGGETTQVLKPGPQANTFQSPVFLPDGRHFLFHAGGLEPGIYVGRLGGSDQPKRLLDAVGPAFAKSGQLLFVRQGTLFAQTLSQERLELTGDPITVAEHIVVRTTAGAAVSASASGSIAYRTGSSDLSSQFVWFDRSGRMLESVEAPSESGGLSSSLSPDGRRLAITRNISAAAADIWVLDLNRGVPSRLTFDKAFDLTPVWSPDGRRIAFGSNRRGTFDPYVKLASATEEEELLVSDVEAGPPSDWSQDGRFILYARQRGPDRDDIWALPLEGGRKPFPVVETTFNEENGQFSPDGKWIAYQSDESGSVEIYVQPFPGPGPKIRISGAGGVQARWRSDGKELFYLGPDDRLMAVPILLDRDNVDVGMPMPLFATNLRNNPVAPRFHYARHYMVSPDGQRFLVNVAKEVTLPITLILNWKPTQ